MLQLALRNLARNRRRSVITFSAVTVGVWALVFIWAFIDGINEQMIVNNIQYLTGHLKIHRLGYHDEKELALSIPEQEPVIFSELPLGSAFAPRIESYALVSTGDASATVMVYGVDPAREGNVTTLHETVIEGHYLTGAELEIFIGDVLAEELEVSVGETIDVIVQAADGSIGADRFELTGIFDSGINTLDNSLAFIPLQDAQEIYSMWGQYSAWSIKLENRQAVASTSEMLAASLGQDYEVYPWTALLPSVVQAVEFHEAIACVVLAIVFVVVTAGIANTLLMSVMERMHEFGVMRALGTQPAQIMSLVIWESLAIGVIGILFGNLIGIAFTSIWTESGMDLSNYTEAMETMPGLSGIVFPLLRTDHLLLISAIVLVVCLLPALAPAWRAARLPPVTAMRGTVESSKLAGRLERLRVLPAGWLWGQMAWRSLFRNFKRSTITGAASAFGMASFIFLYAFTDGFFEQMIDNSTQLLTSHAQIKVPRTGKSEILFDQALLSDEMFQHPGIAASSQRLVVPVMVSSAEEALPVDWIGVDPVAEKEVTRLHNLLNQGSYLTQQQSGIIIGQSLAEDLEVEIGHRVVLTGQDQQNQLISTAVRVSGIFNTGSELFDSGYVFSPIDQIQSLFSVESSQISHVALRLDDRHLSTSIAQQINSQLVNSPLQAESWETIMPVVVQMVDMTRIDFYLVLAVIYLVVCIGVMNTMLMSVLERTREFGVLLALGTAPNQIVRTLLIEASFIGAAGILLGAGIGIVLAQYYSVEGINLAAFIDSMAAIPGMTDRVYPELISGNLVLPTLMLYVAGLLVSVYPALKAAYLRPVEAIRA